MDTESHSPNNFQTSGDATNSGNNFKIDSIICNFEIKIDCKDLLSKLLAGKDTNEAVQASLSASEIIQDKVKDVVQGALKAALKAANEAKKPEGLQKATNAEVPKEAKTANDKLRPVKLKRPLSSPAEEEGVLKKLVELIRRKGEDCPRFVIDPADFPNWLHIMRKIVSETGFVDTHHKLCLSRPCECCSNCTNSENKTDQRPLKIQRL